MGYFNSYGQWVNTGAPTNQTPVSFPNSYPQQPINSAWGGSPQQNQFSIVPVSGRATAEDYPVAPGAKVMMIDQNDLVAYVKERDMQGRSMPFLVYDLVVREEPKPVEPVQASQSVDYDRIRAMISEEVNAAMSNRRSSKKEGAK